jgi:hypothetical protein
MYALRDWVSGIDHQAPPSFENLSQNAAGKAAKAPQVFTRRGPVYRRYCAPRRLGHIGANITAAASAAVFSPFANDTFSQSRLLPTAAVALAKVQYLNVRAHRRNFVHPHLVVQPPGALAKRLSARE